MAIHIMINSTAVYTFAPFARVGYIISCLDRLTKVKMALPLKLSMMHKQTRNITSGVSKSDIRTSLSAPNHFSNKATSTDQTPDIN
eukprot:scaffold96675_cov27-Cyclotella_meneghiniana.AAC.2